MSWFLYYEELFDTSANGYQTSDTSPATQFQQILHVFVHFTRKLLTVRFLGSAHLPKRLLYTTGRGILTKNNLMNPKYKQNKAKTVTT